MLLAAAGKANSGRVGLALCSNFYLLQNNAKKLYNNVMKCSAPPTNPTRRRGSRRQRSFRSAWLALYRGAARRHRGGRARARLPKLLRGARGAGDGGRTRGEEALSQEDAAGAPGQERRGAALQRRV
jgi:hypothetical protein